MEVVLRNLLVDFKILKKYLGKCLVVIDLKIWLGKYQLVSVPRDLRKKVEDLFHCISSLHISLSFTSLYSDHYPSLYQTLITLASRTTINVRLGWPYRKRYERCIPERTWRRRWEWLDNRTKGYESNDSRCITAKGSKRSSNLRGGTSSFLSAFPPPFVFPLASLISPTHKTRYFLTAPRRLVRWNWHWWIESPSSESTSGQTCREFEE